MVEPLDDMKWKLDQIFHYKYKIHYTPGQGIVSLIRYNFRFEDFWIFLTEQMYTLSEDLKFSDGDGPNLCRVKK